MEVPNPPAAPELPLVPAKDTASRTYLVPDLVDLGAALVTAGLLALVLAGRGGPARILLALVFAFFVPGRAVVTNWPRLARWSGVGGSVVLSLALLTLTATLTLWFHLWDPVLLFYFEAALSWLGLAVGAWRRWQAARGSGALTQSDGVASEVAADIAEPDGKPGAAQAASDG